MTRVWNWISESKSAADSSQDGSSGVAASSVTIQHPDYSHIPYYVQRLECNVCEQTVPSTVLRLVGPDNKSICLLCLRVALLQCRDCQKPLQSTEVIFVNGWQQIFCSSCLTVAQLKCLHCDKTFPRDEIVISGCYNEPSCRPCKRELSHCCGSP